MRKYNRYEYEEENSYDNFFDGDYIETYPDLKRFGKSAIYDRTEENYDEREWTKNNDYKY